MWHDLDGVQNSKAHTQLQVPEQNQLVFIGKAILWLWLLEHTWQLP
jgi:hypothetical protein